MHENVFQNRPNWTPLTTRPREKSIVETQVALAQLEALGQHIVVALNVIDLMTSFLLC